ncbi:SMI1/KNR4 family protein [Gemella haemolysans]|uniref:SMI1 / KNR4 family protein n=1 Tax=Gemella haemolysans ATCC 10379 TaxID=546270 RepID=C5NXL7_9BACL|nr:SMI1/KNR4 family protein [Gemella haemolysans]EER67767.1 SMI1 / KNR4 family protein [Gemella haemolysans ATCC 10379]KAA8708801.1 SMI1/KNR4 family protein [Gemella haemolysans]UBH82734.1 SMI1/KNR4 family protein [Gemella haemolysans]VEI39006.1 SMI1 / KNR4 family [Gemella haemolysans]
MTIKLDKFGFANNGEILMLENEFEVVLPEDYKSFLLQENGGRNTAYRYKNLVRIPQVSEEINIDVMFGVSTNVKNGDIKQWTSEYQDDLFPNSIIIGDTIQHGFIVFWLSKDDNAGIYFYDDTYEFASSTDNMNTYFLANSFSEFLNMVEN